MRNYLFLLIAALFFSSATVALATDWCFEYAEKKEYDRAIDACSKRINDGQGDAQTYNNRGRSYKNRGQYEQALSDYNKAIELNPKCFHAYTNRGNIYKRRGQYEQALSNYNKAIELNPKYTYAYYNVACLHSVQSASQDACAWLRKAINIGYDKWEHIKQDADFTNIRDSFCYKEIMAGK